MRLLMLSGLITFTATHALHAQIISEALLSFPTETESVEYDNLASLRMLPNYDALQRQFSGKPLEHAKAALAKLGIPAEQVTEMVVGSSPGTLYGLLGGTFRGSVAAHLAAKRSILALKLEDAYMYCPGVGTCLVFLQDWLVAFGTPGELKAMLQARQGVRASLSSNRAFVALMNGTEGAAPVRGVAPGNELNTLIGGIAMDWPQFSAGVSLIGYSVNFDSKAHVTARLECKSVMAATLLKQMLAMLGSLPFQNMQVSLSDATIDLRMDTALPN
jgi:hypothetical protein